MKNARYDEFQIATRHKIAFQSFILVMILIGLNGYIKEGYGTWASPLLEAFIMVWIPGLYFAVMAISKNAYFSKNDYPIPVVVLLGLAAAMGVFSTVPSIFSEESLIENGQFSDRIMGLLIAIISVGMGVALIVRRVLNRRMDGKGE
jgi:hypothetical protein